MIVYWEIHGHFIPQNRRGSKFTKADVIIQMVNTCKYTDQDSMGPMSMVL